MSVKIGFVSKRSMMHDRLSKLQIGSHRPLTVLGVAEGAREREQELHRQFSDERYLNEWFRLTPRIIDFIENNCRPFVTVSDRASVMPPVKRESLKPREVVVRLAPIKGTPIQGFIDACTHSDELVPAGEVHRVMRIWREQAGHTGESPSARALAFALLQSGFKRHFDRRKRAYYAIKLPDIVCSQTEAKSLSA